MKVKSDLKKQESGGAVPEDLDAWGSGDRLQC